MASFADFAWALEPSYFHNLIALPDLEPTWLAWFVMGVAAYPTFIAQGTRPLGVL